jgi:hypothetical protein
MTKQEDLKDPEEELKNPVVDETTKQLQEIALELHETSILEGDKAKQEKWKEFKTERLLPGEVTDKHVDEIYELEKRCFKEDALEEKEECAEVLRHPEALNMLLKDEQGLTGHINAIPHNEEVKFFKEFDPETREIAKALYVENLDIDPRARTFTAKALRQLCEAFAEEAKKAGYERLTMYAEVENGMSKFLQKMAGAEFLRHHDDWLEMGPHDYLEIDLTKPTKPQRHRKEK